MGRGRGRGVGGAAGVKIGGREGVVMNSNGEKESRIFGEHSDERVRRERERKRRRRNQRKRGEAA